MTVINMSKRKPNETINGMLRDGWFEHFSKPIEDQILIDKQRLVPVFETMRLYRLAQNGKIDFN